LRGASVAIGGSAAGVAASTFSRLRIFTAIQHVRERRGVLALLHHQREATALPNARLLAAHGVESRQDRQRRRILSREEMIAEHLTLRRGAFGGVGFQQPVNFDLVGQILDLVGEETALEHPQVLHRHLAAREERLRPLRCGRDAQPQRGRRHNIDRQKRRDAGIHRGLAVEENLDRATAPRARVEGEQHMVPLARGQRATHIAHRH
jgi:hypothetical protein